MSGMESSEPQDSIEIPSNQPKRRPKAFPNMVEQFHDVLESNTGLANWSENGRIVMVPDRERYNKKE